MTIIIVLLIVLLVGYVPFVVLRIVLLGVLIVVNDGVQQQALLEARVIEA